MVRLMDWLSLSAEEKEILNVLSNGSFQITEHAMIRMGERALDREDISNCATTAESIHKQRNKSFKIEGKDTMGCSMVIIADYDNGAVIITVW